MRTWLWPDRNIGKRESRRLREEHNAAISAAFELADTAKTVLIRLDLEAKEHPDTPFPANALREDLRRDIALVEALR